MSIPTASAAYLCLARAALCPSASGETLPTAILASLLEAQAQGAGSIQLEESALQQLLGSGHARFSHDVIGGATPLMVVEGKSIMLARTHALRASIRNGKSSLTNLQRSLSKMHSAQKAMAAMPGSATP